MIKLWGRKNAYNVQKVLWTLHELKFDYIHHDVGSVPVDLETEEFLSRNPHARIPVISDNNELIWESNTIIRYLASSYSHGNLWNTDPVKRSRADRWMDWELATLQPDFIDLFWSYYRTPQDQHDLTAIGTSKKHCESHFQKLDQHLENNKYLAGDSFTMGDIPCATGLYRYLTMGLDVEQPPHVLAWYKRLSQRKAFQQCIVVPYDELKGRIQF